MKLLLKRGRFSQDIWQLSSGPCEMSTLHTFSWLPVDREEVISMEISNLGGKAKKNKKTVFLVASKSWHMLLEYRIETRTITKDNTTAIPHLRCQSVDAITSIVPSHSNQRGRTTHFHCCQSITQYREFSQKYLLISTLKNAPERHYKEVFICSRDLYKMCYIYQRK